jgi:hypothetical protein
MNVIQAHLHVARRGHGVRCHRHLRHVAAPHVRHPANARLQQRAAALALTTILVILRYGLCRGCARAEEAGEHLVGRSEGEIVQHEDDFLPILGEHRFIVDNERRGHQPLFLQFVMRVHPVRSGDRSIVVGLNNAVLDRRGLRPWESILRPGR